jgi:hypothetical protein
VSLCNHKNFLFTASNVLSDSSLSAKRFPRRQLTRKELLMTRMPGPSRLHQGGSEFASPITGHNVDLGNKSLTRRDTAQTINHHNYYGHSTAPLEDQRDEQRGEKRKYTDDQGSFSLYPLGSPRHHASRLTYC